ncbi:MAG: hypothetical protein NT179_12425 [Nitrospirae bacterium]|nr:hypothetical protein [Nitrospirota bacterium]
MNNRVAFKSVCCGLVALICSWTGLATSAEPGLAPPVSQQAERSFQQLQQIEQGGKTHEQAGARATVTESAGRYDADQYLIGKGQGDLNKGRMVCQRVSELSARTDLAKQIRVMVKEHMIDRIRERTGREAEQDIELTREEIVQEYLQGVKIVDRQMDEEKKICTATAVMLKSQIQPKPAADHQESTPTAVR